MKSDQLKVTHGTSQVNITNLNRCFLLLTQFFQRLLHVLLSVYVTGVR